MAKKKSAGRHVAKQLSQGEIEERLKEIGTTIKRLRDERTTIDAFAYEINISRSNIGRYEAGSDMYLSNFLKVIHGLGMTPEEFFKQVK